jgi:Protein of unknown function (DUF1275)
VAIELEMLDRAEGRLHLPGPDRRLCGRLRHSCLGRLRVLHERKYDADRHPDRAGPFCGDPTFRGSDHVLRYRQHRHAGALLTHSGLCHSRRVLLGAVAALLAVIIAVTGSVSLNAVVGIAVLALTMGTVNTTLSQVGGQQVSLTFVTGDLARIARHLAMAVIQAPVQGARGSWDTHLYRACMGWLPDRRGAVRSSDPTLWGVGPAASVPDPALPGRAQRCR